jgi:hypothetical protein
MKGHMKTGELYLLQPFTWKYVFSFLFTQMLFELGKIITFILFVNLFNLIVELIILYKSK